MKRSGFKSRGKPLQRRAPISAPQLERAPLPAHRLTVTPNYARCTVSVPVPKHDYVRSPKLREAYRLIPCQLCGRDDGTVCCAHSNWSIHGKGKAIKADDNRGASLCAACHVPLLDQGSALSRAERQALWWDAHVKTVTLLLSLGHWPAGIPVPDTRVFPW